MSFGITDVAGIKLGDGIDTAILHRSLLEDGTTYEAVLAEASAAVNAFNRSVDPLLAMICRRTTSRTIRVPQGSMTFGKATEYSRPNAQRLTAQGWMLQKFSYDLGIDFTWQYLRHCQLEDLRQNLRAMVNAARDLWQYQTLNRLMDSTEIAVESGYSPGLANNNSNVAYTPPPYMGSTFASTHSHCNRANGLDDCAAANSADLIEHGFYGPWIHLVSAADRTSWTSEANFVLPEVSPLRKQTDVDVAVGSQYVRRALGDWRIGYCEDGDVIPVPRIPTKYTATIPVREDFSPDNPVAVMLPREGVPLLVRPDRDLLRDGLFFFSEGYVGVADPIGAAIAENDTSGSYDDPTIAQ